MSGPRVRCHVCKPPTPIGARMTRTFAILSLFLALPVACSGPQSPSSGSPPPAIDARTIIRAIAAVSLPQIEAQVLAQLSDPVQHAAAVAAFDQARPAIDAATSRSLCEALPIVDSAATRLGVDLAAIPRQSQQALVAEAGGVVALHVTVAILQATQCRASGTPSGVP